MGRDTRITGAKDDRPESYVRALGNLLGVALALAGIAAVMVVGSPDVETRKDAVVTPATVPPTKPLASKARDEKPPIVAPAPTPPLPRLEIDRAAVAKAEAAVEEAAKDRARAEARALEASKALEEATSQSALDAKVIAALSDRAKDPGARIEQASARGGFLKAETDKLKGEIATLAQVPRPKSKVLSNKNPVARPAENEEYHFELRRNRVSYIDLDKLVALIKADIDLRMRLADGARTIGSKVGPVGAFSLEYEFRRSLPARLEDMVDRRSVTYRPSGWEVVPEFEGRGETFEATRRPISDYARAINRLSPGRATITMWVYPDSFGLYRKLRDDLQARGYLVAGRPLPDGMAIRGGPGGSVSAGQ